MEHRDTAAYPAASSVSVKTNKSMDFPLRFSEGVVTFEPSCERDYQICVESKCVVCREVLKDPVSITCGHSFCRKCIICYWEKLRQAEYFDCPHCKKRSKTHSVLQTVMGASSSAGTADSNTQAALQEETGDLQKAVDDKLQRVRDKHKTRMKNKYESLFEGMKLQENETLLNRIYTQLYIIEGESDGVNEEHEVLQMEKTARTQLAQDTSIYCNDMFNPLESKGIFGAWRSFVMP